MLENFLVKDILCLAVFYTRKLRVNKEII